MLKDKGNEACAATRELQTVVSYKYACWLLRVLLLLLLCTLVLLYATLRNLLMIIRARVSFVRQIAVLCLAVIQTSRLLCNVCANMPILSALKAFMLLLVLM